MSGLLSGRIEHAVLSGATDNPGVVESPMDAMFGAEAVPVAPVGSPWPSVEQPSPGRGIISDDARYRPDQEQSTREGVANREPREAQGQPAAFQGAIDSADFRSVRRSDVSLLRGDRAGVLDARPHGEQRSGAEAGVPVEGRVEVLPDAPGARLSAGVSGALSELQHGEGAGRVSTPTVYLGGPIDYVTSSPEARHRRLTLALMTADGGKSQWHHHIDVYCPACALQTGDTPESIVERNMRALLTANWAVFETRPDVPTFGTPIEIWVKAEAAAGRVLIVGELGGGIFAQVLTKAGVRVVNSWAGAVAAIVQEERQ